MQISEQLIFYPERGLFSLSDGHEICIASTGNYVTPLFVAALNGKLADKYPQLLKSKEWQSTPVRTTFDSYKELSHFVTLSEHEAVQTIFPEDQTRRSLSFCAYCLLPCVQQYEPWLHQLPF